jgi:hypothetical protein
MQRSLNDWMTTGTAAELLGVTSEGVRLYLRRAHRGQRVGKPGSLTVFQLKDLRGMHVPFERALGLAKELRDELS